MITPTDILDDVRNAFAGEVNLLSAYQILDKFPQATRYTVIAERGINDHYNAGTVVSQAAKMLADRGELEQYFLDTRNVKFTVNGEEILRGAEVLAVYRLVRS